MTPALATATPLTNRDKAPTWSRGLESGTAYAVWVGIGAVLTVVHAMATGGESVSPLKLVFLAGIVGSVIGLKLTH